MKPSTLKTLLAKRLIYLLAIGAFFLFSCNHAHVKSNEEPTLSSLTNQSSNSYLLDTLETKTLIQNYHNDTSNVDQDFLMQTSLKITADKVVSFRMTSSQKTSFYQKLGTLRSLVNTDSNVDSVRILVHLAFWDPGQYDGNELSSNFTPLIQLVVNKDSLIYPSYPMQSFISFLDWANYNCDTLNQENPNNKNEQISCSVAKSLVLEWLETPADSLNDKLFLYELNSNNHSSYEMKDRVQYYTFNNSDTEKINNQSLIYLNHQEETSQNQTYNFYLHFGIHDSIDMIPLRTVIHLDLLDLGQNTPLVNNNSTYFEFSRPCPKYCNKDLELGFINMKHNE